MKKIIILLAVGLTLMLAACSAANTADTNADTSGISGTDVYISSEPSSEPTEPTEAEETKNSTKTPEDNVPGSTSAPASSGGGSKSGTGSNTANPPASNSQAPTQPVTSNPPATSTPPPSNPTSSAPSTSTPTPAKPAYTQADYDAIIETVSDYAKTKEFVPDDSLYFGQKGVGCYGRPSLERDGYERVIETLKGDIDLLVSTYGRCSYRVIMQEYAGNTEFMVLYR